MSTNQSYIPDADAIPGEVLYTALLSTRDVSIQIPINFVTVPGLALTSACFANGRYEDISAKRCFSNLLAAQVRRFEIDVFWDASRALWTLCPVELGSLGVGAGSSGAAASTASPAASISNALLSTSVDKLRRDTHVLSAAAAKTLRHNKLAVRQAATSTLSASDTTATNIIISSATTTDTAILVSNATTTFASTSAALGTAAPATISGSAETLYQIGHYSCTSSINLEFLSNVLVEHLSQTENNLNATTKYLIINIHAAAPASDPGGSAVNVNTTQLPSPGNYLSEAVNSTLSSYVYTPYTLANDRANLNRTWFDVSIDYQPNSAYLETTLEPDGYLSTENGWPSESYLELVRAKRLLVGFGEIDPQMAAYNTSTDGSTLFAAGMLSMQRDTTLSSDGTVVDGCFFKAGVKSLSAINSSWAVSTDLITSGSDTNLDLVYDAANNVTTCGISPFLNHTLGNTTADANITSYSSFVRSAIWSWASGQPRDDDFDFDNDDSALYHCAVLNATNAGRWRVANCNNRYYAACRVANDPYTWVLSDQSGYYDAVASVCPSGSSFSTPQTALENAYLRAAVAEWKADNGYNDQLFWLNMNDLDVAGCWVNGVNSTCPYVTKQLSTGRTVVVPTVAAVIVFVLAALMIFVKCAANRQNTKRRRRRGENGWDYEGVPS